MSLISILKHIQANGFTPEVNNKFSLDELKVLHKILEEYEGLGTSETLEALWKNDFETRPVSIDEFLENDYYLGRIGRDIYPAWRKDLTYVLNPLNNIGEWILKGSVGSGKTFVAVIANIYKIYYLLCLHNPQRFYGLAEGSPVVFGLFNIFKYLAGATSYQYLTTWLRDMSPYFSDQRGDHLATSKKISDKEVLKLPKNISIALGAAAIHALGQNIFGGLCDETEFGKQKSITSQEKSQVADLYHNVRTRMDSRFMQRGGANPGLLCLSLDTEVDLLSGVKKRLSEFNPGEDAWLYSVKDGEVVPALGKYLGVTRRCTDLLTVTLDNNRSVKCTPDHRFMLRDGSYKRADELRIGESLMPLYKRLYHGYETVMHPCSGRYEATHKLVSRYAGITGSAPEGQRRVIHHKNFNKRDNTPSNLVAMGDRDHFTLHSKVVSRLWDDPEFRANWSQIASRNGKLNGPKNLERYKTEDREYFRSVVSSNGFIYGIDNLMKYVRSDANRERMKVLGSQRLKKAWQDPEFRKRKSELTSKRLRESWQDPYMREVYLDNLSNCWQKPKHLSWDAIVDAFCSSVTLEDALLRLDCSYSTLNRKLREYGNTKIADLRYVILGEDIRAAPRRGRNHKVTSVVESGTGDVGCFHVEDTHNFGLHAGVFVHNCLVSSARDFEQFLAQHVRQTADDPHTYVSQYALYEVKEDVYKNSERFTVVIGDKLHRSYVLEDDPTKEVRDGARTVKVPREFHPRFKYDIDSAIRDICGVETYGSTLFLPQRDRLLACEESSVPRRHPFSQDEVVLSIDDDVSVEDYFLQDEMVELWDKSNLLYRPKFYAHADRFVHVDLAKNRDCAGIAMSCISESLVVTRFNKAGMPVKVRDYKHFIDFMLRIRAAHGSEIDFAKIRRFIFFLVDTCKFRIRWVSYDSYQSTDSIQIFKKEHIQAKELSLDRKPGPYRTFRSVITEGRLDVYHYDPFYDEITKLEDHTQEGGKIDHPVGGSKDVSDGACGSVCGSLLTKGHTLTGSDSSMVSERASAMEALVEQPAIKSSKWIAPSSKNTNPLDQLF